MASTSPSLSVTTATGFLIFSAISKNRRKDVPTEITSISSYIGSLLSCDSMYAFCMTSSSESPSTKMAFLQRISLNVS